MSARFPGRSALRHAWTARALSGLVTSFRADVGLTLISGRVSAWLDQSGTGDANKNLAQSASGNRPLFNAVSSFLNGRPSLTLDNARADNLFSGTWAVPMPSPCTWVLVGRVSGRDVSGYSVALTGDSVQHAVDTAPGNRLLYASGTVREAGSVPNGTNVVIVAILGTSGKLYVNARTAVDTGNTGTNGLTSLRIGATSAPSNGWTGELAQVHGYNRALSQAEVERVLAEYGAEYAIAIAA